MADDIEPGAGAREAASEPGAAGQGVGDPPPPVAPQANLDAATVGPDRAADFGAGPAVALAKAVPLQPRWLRPAIVFTVALAHAGTLTALAYVHSERPPAVVTIEATVIAAGDEAPVDSPAAHAPEPANEPAPGAKSQPPSEQDEASPAPVVADAPPPPPPEPAPAVAVAEGAPPPPPADQTPPAETLPRPTPALDPPPPNSAAETPAPPPPPVMARIEEPPPAVERQLETAPPPPPPTLRVEKTPRPMAEAKPAVERAKSPKAAAPKAVASRSDAAASRTEASEAHRVGTASGRPVDAGASRASYAALVVAEIQAHRFYPASARERGDQGAVGVSFTIGPSGRVAAASVVQPSGFAELDEAARQIVRSISPPPPPGGSFTASTTIRFHFE
jgi:protein TonB